MRWRRASPVRKWWTRSGPARPNTTPGWWRATAACAVSAKPTKRRTRSCGCARTRPATSTARCWRSMAVAPRACTERGAARASGALEDRGDALAPADAHRRQAKAAAGAVQFVHQLDGDDRAGRAHRMAQRDAAPVGIGLPRIEAERVGHRAGLGGESLVGFDHVEVVHLQPGAGQRGARR